LRVVPILVVVEEELELHLLEIQAIIVVLVALVS
jgi:hypothetical protein